MKPQILMLFLFFFSSSVLLADTLELSNGDTITGKIISMDEEEIIIETEYGRLEVKRKYIIKGVFAGDGTDITVSENPDSKDPLDNSDGEYPGDIPRNGLVCEFLFDNTFTDSVSTLYTVKNVGELQFCKGIDGIENHAVSSDGTGRHLVLTGHNELDEFSSFTISFWINVENWEKTQYILSKWTSTDGEKAHGKFAVYTKQGFVLCYIVDAAGTYHNLYTDKPMKLHAWNHIAVAFDRGIAVIYINNKKEGEKTFDFTELKKDTSPLYILTAKALKGNTYAYYSFTGMMDNLRIYNRALSEDEAAILFLERNSL